MAEQGLCLDATRLHTDHLGDLDDAAHTVSPACLLHDEIERRRQLLADRSDRQIDSGHQHHDLEARQRITRGVRVHRRQRAVVASVHCLQHVERLASTALADQDAVGAHAQRIAHEIADGDRALSFAVGGSDLERYQVRMLQAQLGRVLDRDQAFIEADRARQQVQQAGLAGPGAARHHDVATLAHTELQELHHRLRRRPEAHQIGGSEQAGVESADRDR